MKPGGWEKYGQATDDIAANLVEVVEAEKDIDVIIRKIDKLQDMAKFIAFDKTKIKHKKTTVTNKAENSIEAKEVLKRQSEQLEKEILEIKNNKQGRATKVFKMKSRIGGSKNQSQEAHAIIDPNSGEILVSSEEIKRATLEYNCKVLKNNEAEIIEIILQASSLCIV